MQDLYEVGGLLCSLDPESYAGSSVTAGRATLVGQV